MSDIQCCLYNPPVLHVSWGGGGVVAHLNATKTTTPISFCLLVIIQTWIFPVSGKYQPHLLAIIYICYDRLVVTFFLYLYINVCIKTQNPFFCTKWEKIYINAYILCKCKQCLIQWDWIYEYILYLEICFKDLAVWQNVSTWSDVIRPQLVSLFTDVKGGFIIDCLYKDGQYETSKWKQKHHSLVVGTKVINPTP